MVLRCGASAEELRLTGAFSRLSSSTTCAWFLFLHAFYLHVSNCKDARSLYGCDLYLCLLLCFCWLCLVVFGCVGCVWLCWCVVLWANLLEPELLE
jgi:hypothetical protein